MPSTSCRKAVRGAAPALGTGQKRLQIAPLSFGEVGERADTTGGHRPPPLPRKLAAALCSAGQARSAVSRTLFASDLLNTNIPSNCFFRQALNHERLTWRHEGRDFRLTDVFGNVVKGVLARPERAHCPPFHQDTILAQSSCC